MQRTYPNRVIRWAIDYTGYRMIRKGVGNRSPQRNPEILSHSGAVASVIIMGTILGLLTWAFVGTILFWFLAVPFLLTVVLFLYGLKGEGE